MYCCLSVLFVTPVCLYNCYLIIKGSACSPSVYEGRSEQRCTAVCLSCLLHLYACITVTWSSKGQLAHHQYMRGGQNTDSCCIYVCTCKWNYFIYILVTILCVWCGCVCIHVCVCVHACVCAGVHSCVCAYVFMCTLVLFACTCAYKGLHSYALSFTIDINQDHSQIKQWLPFQVAGKLHIEISKMGGAILDRYVDLTAEGNQEETVPMGAPLLIRVGHTGLLSVRCYW